MLEMKEKWKIESMMNDSNTNRTPKKQEFLNLTSEAMLAAMHHEKLMQSKGHSTKFSRSSKLSNKIAHNSYMANAIETSLQAGRIYSGTRYVCFK